METREHDTPSDSATHTRTREAAAHGDRPESKIADTLEGAVGALVDVGRLWAVHGLRVGRSALEASALTLRSTGDLLGQISSQLDPERTDASSPTK